MSSVYKVHVGSSKDRKEAEETREKMKALGFNAFIVFIRENYKVQIGAYENPKKAERITEQIKKNGFNVTIERVRIK